MPDFLSKAEQRRFEMNRYARHFGTQPQSEPLVGKKQIQNAAGGYVFEIDNWQRLRRFLILGCEGGTYYESERKLTLENAQCVLECLKEDQKRVVDLIVEVSDKGLAPKNDAAIFALALVSVHGYESPDLNGRKLAFEALPKVCRIGTHLFQFVAAREALEGGWGRGMRNAVAHWFNQDDIILQALKYQQRGGWSMRDLLRLSHPKKGPAHVFDAICRPENWAKINHPLAEGYVRAQAAKTAKEVAEVISNYSIPREFIPTGFLTDPVVWDALLPKMPLTALVRNLGNMSKSGLLVPLSEAAKTVQSKLSDKDAIRKSRLHPFAILLAHKTYAQGHGVKGSGKWEAVPQVTDALDSAFYEAFHNVEPTNKRYLLGVDVSGSMSMAGWGGTEIMTPAEAAAAMALVTARTEPNYYIMGFATDFRDLKITANDTLESALDKTRRLNFGGTDTSVALNWAIKKHIEVDAFVIYTDNETWAGDRHTSDVLNTYRRTLNLPSKLAVVAFTATNRSIADNGDVNSMDFTGMDASLPQALAAFIQE